MPGIIVGIDGSVRSRQALEWAVNEAAIRHTPLTVLTVNQTVTSGGTCLDVAGKPVPALSFGPINIDRTPPSSGSRATPAPTRSTNR